MLKSEAHICHLLPLQDCPVKGKQGAMESSALLFVCRLWRAVNMYLLTGNVES